MESLYVKTRVLAEMLGVSQKSVRDQCAKGLIPGAKRFGATWLIPREFADSYQPKPKKHARSKPEPLEIVQAPTVFDEIRKRPKSR